MITEPYKVTVCVPVYNVEGYIERCARSLFEQTYEGVEYVFIDDCGQDRSIEILESIIEEYPKRAGSIRIVRHEKNRGLAAVRNTGVANVHTPFMIWVDSDDYAQKNMVEALVENQMLTSADIVCGGVTEMRHTGPYITPRTKGLDRTKYLHELLNGFSEHWIWGKLISIELYKDHDIQNVEGMNMGEDYQVFPRLVFYSNSVSFVDEPLYNYEQRNDNSLTHVLSEDKQYQTSESWLRTLAFFKDTEFEKDVRHYQAQIMCEHLKPIIRGLHVSDSHKKYLKSYISSIPMRYYLELSLKNKMVVLFSILFVL